MLKWDKLLSPIRRKDLHGKRDSLGTTAKRTELERDYDRILFAGPTRRLADKTQVFPLEPNDSVRTRLTHSHEVSNLARSIGIRLAFDFPEQVFGKKHEQYGVKRNVPALLAATGLAHDLGNPPFGHQGELAIQQWFASKYKGKRLAADFREFDGNAQTFRLLTRLQIINDQFGLNLTAATLAALVKYPSVYGSGNKHGFKKFGIFQSEESVIHDVWKLTGLGPGIRHPFAYVMEACDDIAYSIIDAEDTVKKGYASFYDLMDYLDSHSNDDGVVAEVVRRSREENTKLRLHQLSSSELNDVSMQMFRVIAISIMVPAATEVFVQNVKKMMSGSIPQGFELIANSSSDTLCRVVKAFDRRYAFQHKDVLRLELKGNNYIREMMDMLWQAISTYPQTKEPFEKFVFGSISENYRRIFANGRDTNYYRHQLLCDTVSGMTENYLISKYDEFRSLQCPTCQV
jgi:dGTPase